MAGLIWDTLTGLNSDMSITKIVIRTFFYCTLSCFFFLWFVNMVQFPKQINNVPIISVYNIDNEEKDLDIELDRLEKIILSNEDALISRYLENKIGSEHAVGRKERGQINFIHKIYEEFIFFHYISNNNIVISSIYAITLFTFMLQTSLLACSNHYGELLRFTSKERLDKIFLYSSEWTVNSPPVLGVIGTIFSFGVLVTNISDPSNLTIVFRDNFANAALTTIIGGSVYILNLFMNIFTAKNLVVVRN